MTYEDALRDLRAPLDRSRIKGVTVGGGGQAPYLPAYDVIQTANRIFGEDGWSYRVIGEPQFIQNPALWYVTVEVTALGVTRTDVGTNPLANKRDEPPNAGHFEMSIKGAVSDGLKRALRTFGDQFGLSLADKDAEAEALRQERQQGSQGGAQRSEPSPPQLRAQTPPSDGERPLENVGQLFMWARTNKGIERDAVCKILGVQLNNAKNDITDLEAARTAIKVAVQAGGQGG